MKKFYLLILLITAACTSCKKDNLISESIVGNWELRTEINGLTGLRTTYAAGNGSVLKFSKENYETYSSGRLVKKGVYKVIKETSSMSNSTVNRIVYDNKYDSIKFNFTIENNKLNIWVVGYDAPGAIYEKQ